MASFKGYRRSIVFDFEYSQVTNGTSEINKQMAMLNAEFRRANEEVKATGTTFDGLTISQEKLQTQLRLQTDKVAILRKELEEVSKAEGNNEKAIQRKTIELKNAETALMKTNAQLGKVNREVDKSSTSFGQAKLALQDFNNNADKMGVNLGNVQTQLMGCVAATAAVIGATTSMSMSFDDEFKKVRTIADETEVSFGELRTGVLDMSRDMKLSSVSANDLAGGLYEIISANISTADSMDVLKESAILAETGFTDMKTSTDIMTTVLNAYNMSVSDASTITDQLITIQKLGKLTINELGSDFGRVAGLAASANVELDEMGAAISVLTTNGIKSNEAITAMKAILSAVVKPTKEAADTAKELGINFNASSLQAKGLDGFLQDVQRRCKGNTEDMAKLFGSVEALNAIMILASKEGLNQFNENVGAIQNSTGAADQAMANLDGTSTNFKDSMENLKTTLIEVGDKFAPIVDFIALLFNGISKVNPYLIIAVGTGLLVAKVLTTISAILPVLAATSTLASAGLTKLGIAGGISAGQILIIAAAVALIIGLFAMLSGSADKASNDIRKVGDAANSVANTTMSKAQDTAQKATSSAGRRSYAIGTQYHPGGRALVGEYGPEEVILPRGSKVLTTSETSKNNSSNGHIYNLNNVTIKTNNAEDLFEQIQILVRRGAFA